MSREIKYVTGIAYWACITTPNKMSEKYSVDLIVDKATADELMSMGARAATDKQGNLKHYDDAKNLVFIFKANSKNSKGEPMFPPGVVDAKCNKYEGTIGNGSKVKIAYNLYEYNAKGNKGVALSLNGIQVLDLVEYKSDAASLFSEEEGFVAEEQTPMFTAAQEDHDEI